MKYASFRQGPLHGYGVVLDDFLYPLNAKANMPATLKDLLPRIVTGFSPDLEAATRLRLADLHLLPPIPDPAKVLCVAANFHEDDKPAPNYPLVFTRFADSLTGHDQPLLNPSVSECFDYEGEVALIIGKPGHKIPRFRAQEHIAGYACFNDGSVRDWQKHSTQFAPGKNFYQSGSFGPWMICRTELPDITKSTLRTRVNGVVKQEVPLSRMIFDPAWLISYISTFTPLAVGDVIVTGTPGGFGATRKPPEFLRPGDCVEVEVTAIGTLSNIVEQDMDPRSP